MIRRGEIWWASRPDPVGSGPGYRRPAVILQSNEFNESLIRTVVIVAMTSNLRLAEAPGNVKCRKRDTGLPQDSVVNVSQVMTIDKRLLTKRAGLLPGPVLRQVEDGVRLALDL